MRYFGFVDKDQVLHTDYPYKEWGKQRNNYKK